MNRVADIRQQLIEAKKGVGPEDMIELLGVSFIADEPSIFGEPNEDYIRRELAWYETRQPNIHYMEEPIPKIWRQVSDERGNVNSHYGHLVYSEENGNQFLRVIEELKRDPSSRRAVMIYTRPSMHKDAVKDGMDDFVCTNTVQYLIRDGALHVVVQMRSNDAIFGYRNDWPWQVHVQKTLIRGLGLDDAWAGPPLHVTPGDIIWQAGSLHVYPRHHHLVTA